MEGLKLLSLLDTAIREFPPSFGNLIGLEELHVGSNSYSCRLPSSIYKLQHLHLLCLYGNVRFPKEVEIHRQEFCNSYGGFSKYGFLSLNCLKKLTSCFLFSEKCLLLGNTDFNLPESIIKCSRLRCLKLRGSKFLQDIPSLPENITEVYAANCISLNSHSLSKIFLQLRRVLRLPQNLTCLGVKGEAVMHLQSHHILVHQIDYSSRLSHLEFFVIEAEFCRPLDGLHNYIEDYTRRGCQIVVPGHMIPKWFNHQTIESSISFWVGPEFPTFALCLAFYLVPLKDNYAYDDEYGSLHDDVISFVCVVNIFTNGHERPFGRRKLFQYLQSNHLWLYSAPHSQLQQEFGDLIQGDRNHVEVSCKISHWTSKTGKFAPVIARLGVHVECICPPQNPIIIHNNSHNVDDNSDSTELTPLRPPFSTYNGSHMNYVSLNGLRRRRTSPRSSP
ncbi:hypothetical protein SO802_013858 [Lithocarpus litseifolius]|uniref:C-JID domain-containing protein n=1 Tax=Lithocarpus litseifolius TaxID=425828 RepID=A0AAW2D7B6_9ROSI